MRKVLTIAGSDCSGGAGIQADLKTMCVHGVYGMSVITALTAQNTTGVADVLEASPEFVAKQIDCVFNDIRPNAVKIGMVSNSEIIKVIAEKLREYKAEHIVVDPVMVATSGSRLMQDSASISLVSELFPIAEVITPNLSETSALCGFDVDTETDMVKAAEIISGKTNGAVLVKGGHLSDSANDLLYMDKTEKWFRSERVDNPNNHGSGCTLSSAIACNLALGKSVAESVENAKKYITLCMKAGLDLGHGSGPLKHNFNIEEGGGMI